jgi:hypothetical protein
MLEAAAAADITVAVTILIGAEDIASSFSS